MTFYAGISFKAASDIMYKFLTYEKDYEGKETFSRFFCKTYFVTGSRKDFVSQHNMLIEFEEFAGDIQYSTKKVHKHLLASGLKVFHSGQEHCAYGGITFLDSRARSSTFFAKPKEGKRKLQEAQGPKIHSEESIEDALQKHRQKKTFDSFLRLQKTVQKFRRDESDY